MKRVFLSALVAVFLSLSISGCYTKLKGSAPATGERVYNDTYYDDYYGDSYAPYNYHNGWYGSYLYGYPSFDHFYSPWWYNPNYGGGGSSDGRTPGSKEIRSRRGNSGNNLPEVPGNSYTPPPSSGQGSGTTQTPPSNSNPPSNNGGNDSTNSSGKSTRGRR